MHKREVLACLLVGTTHERPRRDVRRFATLTVSLRELRDWLVSAGCTHVAMESTGPYWRPVFNLLEGAVTVVLANARHIKNVPGRKTDVRDCEWIAQLLRCGLIRGSFIPPAAIRELRDLTRYRRQLVEEGTRARNRVQKLLEHANVKPHTLTRQAPREEDATQREPREERPWRNRSLALRRSLVSRADA